jgi:type VI secretion system protein ImpF
VTDDLRPRPGSAALLFERLIDDAPAVPREPYPLRVRDARGTLDSIRREVARLIGTRRPVGLLATGRAEPRTVLDYGLPDITALSPSSADHRRAIAGALERVIAAYEPRLQRPRVTVERDPAEPSRLTARIAGDMAIGPVVQTVSFAVPLDGNGGGNGADAGSDEDHNSGSGGAGG